MKKLTLEEIAERILKIHNGRVLLVQGQTYINSKEKLWFEDVEYGKWQATLNNILMGYGHKARGLRSIEEKLITPLNEVKRRLAKIHADSVSVVDETYERVTKKCIFVDKDYGSWLAIPNSVLSGCGHPQRGPKKMKSTMLNRYGVKHSMHSAEFALKQARTSNKIIDIVHWKTGEPVPCHGSYEVKTIEYFNKNQIDFEAQKHVFMMPNGKTYRPDFYLPEKDLWIEVKGWMRKDAQEKWDLFHENHPNSELWDKKRLKELGIL